MSFELGDRIEYWYADLRDGRTVRRGTIISILRDALSVREDYVDWPVVIAKADVIRKIA